MRYQTLPQEGMALLSLVKTGALQLAGAVAVFAEADGRCRVFSRLRVAGFGFRMAAQFLLNLS